MNRKITRRLYVTLAAFLLLLLSLGSAAYAADGPAAGAKKLIMGTSPDYPPYESVDAKNGCAIVGMDIDIAKLITNRLGYELEFASMDFSGLIAALQTGRVDFVMSGMSVTEERKQSVAFSDSYYTARNTIVSRKDDAYESTEQLAGKLVGDFNRVLEEMKESGELQSIIDKWFGEKKDSSEQKAGCSTILHSRQSR